MATIVDEREEEIAEEVQESQQFVEEPQEQSQEEELPDKYRGKSIQDLVRMHQEAEKLAGRHSNEVGELRRVVDTYIKAELDNKESEPEEEVDFFADPDKAVARAIERHPTVQKAEQISQQYTMEQAQQKMRQLHPDMESILQTREFQEWVGASKIRQGLLLQAHRNYDVEAGNEIFSLWKERQGVVKDTVEAERQARRSDVKKAATGSPRGSSEAAGKKRIRRRDIIELMNNNPAKYEAMQDEIMQAYREGRVY